MIFSSLIFICFFIPCFFLVYYLSPKKYKNLWALFGSYFFYTWGSPKIVFFLIASSFIDFNLSKKFAKDPKAKIYLLFGISLNLGFLIYFKYANFFLSEVNYIWTNLGFTPFTWSKITLPIGISFFTFQKISYLVDVYRTRTKISESFTQYALYVALFPQLIAGPIVRYHDIAMQLSKPDINLDNISYGIYRFCIGLGKKILIANSMGNVADKLFSLNHTQLSPENAWLGAICYAYQIYFDFSAYSDMAIGLGRMMGYTFLENFNAPYISTTITDFWRRWHISLSNWMKEYLYIPLGGNRFSNKRTFLNLWLVFILSGLWHGASWTFIIWGIYHGFFLICDKLFWIKLSNKIPKIVNVLFTFIIVVFSWVFFRAENLNLGLAYLSSMLFIKYGEIPETKAIFFTALENREFYIFCLASLLSFSPLIGSFRKIYEGHRNLSKKNSTKVIRGILSILILTVSLCTLTNTSFNPFIYFRF